MIQVRRSLFLKHAGTGVKSFSEFSFDDENIVLREFFNQAIYKLFQIKIRFAPFFMIFFMEITIEQNKRGIKTANCADNKIRMSKYKNSASSLTLSDDID